MPEPILSVRGLERHFRRRAGWLGRDETVVRAVDGVSFDLFEGETLGLVGESGCGKSTTGRTIVGAYPATGGQALYRTQDGREVDLARAGTDERRRLFGEIRMVFQDPQSSLNPRMRVSDIVGEPLRNLGLARGAARRDAVRVLLARVGLRPEYAERYPHAFSGGERQRIGIARAIAPHPRLLIADEAVSALDVSIRAQILNLLAELQATLGLTYLFISHDMSVVRRIASRVAVMYVGRIVEIASTSEIFARPLHPYSRALLAAVPDVRALKGERARPARLKGEVADPADPPPGCHFHPRCRFAGERCRAEVPTLRRIGPSEVACHHAEAIAAAPEDLDHDIGDRMGGASWKETTWTAA